MVSLYSVGRLKNNIRSFKYYAQLCATEIFFKNDNTRLSLFRENTCRLRNVSCSNALYTIRKKGVIWHANRHPDEIFLLNLPRNKLSGIMTQLCYISCGSTQKNIVNFQIYIIQFLTIFVPWKTIQCWRKYLNNNYFLQKCFIYSAFVNRVFIKDTAEIQGDIPRTIFCPLMIFETPLCFEDTGRENVSTILLPKIRYMLSCVHTNKNVRCKFTT